MKTVINLDILEKMIKEVLGSINEGIILIDSNQTIVYINNFALKILDLTLENVLGKDVTETIPNTRLHFVLKTAVPEYDRIQNLQQNIIITSRIPLFDHSGSIIGVAAIFRDITSVKKLAEEVTDLKEIEARLTAIINSTRDAISVADENGNIILVNPGYTRITGLKIEEVLGKPATIDIAEGNSMHFLVSKIKKPVIGKRLIVGQTRKEVIVDVMPLFIKGVFKGSVGVVHDVTEITHLMEELSQARSLLRRVDAKYTFDDIIGKSEGIRIAVEQAKRVAPTSATVFLRGESGTGKELFAHAIHHSSSRSKSPFVSVNCASLENTIEYELFGYSDGAFSGARKGGKKGLLSEADTGTLFLDEISSLNLSAQSKLLRFLQTKEFYQVGSTKKDLVSVRIIAATNAEIEKLMAEKKFLPDLYFRINVFPIFIPPLRERKEDLPLLSRYILRKLNSDYGRNIRKISNNVFPLFERYDWAGNIRELENTLGRALIKAPLNAEELNLSHFDFFNVFSISKENNFFIPEISLNEAVAAFEKGFISEALKKNNNNREKTAREIGISLRNLYYKISKLEIPGEIK